ncbi:pleckstrin domain-containing protein [Cavenderia fasciculata]|uniref:Pleckstrin domain-containing protein n=1 Tax=Cavenderia fasciculata TaxID=261658 RepID=F4PTA8_CACFS|nr:pleckstrin domain-containing protein [Cavenderia fasciculata]EGG20844.1 pleckstrin domain-containing protein [Cavenderia fasciculata]|eukprot:XP_004358694.1 pleckstrin domain-containing protein [Cavenderia fasciculata]
MGGAVDPGASYSKKTAFIYIFNLVVGIGALGLPLGVRQAGIVLGTLFLAFSGFLAYVTTQWIIEAQAAANFILKTKEDENQVLINHESSPPNVANDFEIVQRTEVGFMAKLFLGDIGHKIFYVILIIYLFGDLAIYAATVPTSLATVTGGFSIGSIHFTDDSVYYFYLVLFAMFVVPFSMFNFQKTKYLQIATLFTRNLAFFLMIILAIIYIAQGNGAKSSELPMFDITHLPKMFGVSIYAFMCHHSLPSIITPIEKKNRLPYLLGFDFIAIFIAYATLCITAMYAFGNVTNPTCTPNNIHTFIPCTIQSLYIFNFSSYNIKIFADFLALFPVFTLSTNYILISITLRNNLMQLIKYKEDTSRQFLRGAIFSVVSSLVPIGIAFITRNVDFLVSITGGYGGLGIIERKRERKRDYNILKKMDSKEIQWAKKLLLDRKQLSFESFDDWKNGVLLLNILEIITAKKLPSKGYPNPRSRIQSIENINISFAFMESSALMLPKCSPQDFVDGNEKSIQSIIYRLYLLSTGKTSSALFYTTKQQQPTTSTGSRHINNTPVNSRGMIHSESTDSLGFEPILNSINSIINTLNNNSNGNNNNNTGAVVATVAGSRDQQQELSMSSMGASSSSSTSSPISSTSTTPIPRSTSSDFKQYSSNKPNLSPAIPYNNSNTTTIPPRPLSRPPSIQSLDSSSSNEIKKSPSINSLSPSSSPEKDSSIKRWRTINQKDRPQSGTGFNLAGSRTSFIDMKSGNSHDFRKSLAQELEQADSSLSSSTITPTIQQQKQSAWFSTKAGSTDKLVRRKVYLKQIIDTERYSDPELLPTIIRCQCIVRTWIATRIVKKRIKFHNHRNRVFKEILSSEENYMGGIEMIVNVFYQQVVWNNKVSPTPYLTQDQINTIFSTVKEIYSFNRELITRLRERSKNWDHRQKIGDIFVTLAPYLKLYKTYCLNYDTAIECLQQAKKNETFKLFIKACLDHPENNMKQSLESLLITVVQRIPRYILLLQDFYRNTWKDHCDYDSLALALKNVQQVADEVNSSIKMAESQSKVLEIQRSLIGWDEEAELVRPSRHFIKQGLVYQCQLDQRFQKDKEELVCFYFNDAILLTEKKADKYQLKFFFETAHLRVKDVEDSAVIQNAIHLIYNGTTAFVSLHTPELKKAMIQFIDKSKPRSSRLTVDISDASTITNMANNAAWFTVQIKKTESKKIQGKKPFTVYYIDILNESTGEQYTIEKRYSDFDSLNNKLKKKFSDSNLKELPKKHLLNNLGTNTVESRRIIKYLLQFISPKANLQKSTSQSSMADEASSINNNNNPSLQTQLSDDNLIHNNEEED